MSEDEVKAVVARVIETACPKADFGKVMSAVMAEVKENGWADRKVVGVVEVGHENLAPNIAKDFDRRFFSATVDKHHRKLLRKSPRSLASKCMANLLFFRQKSEKKKTRVMTPSFRL